MLSIEKILPDGEKESNINDSYSFVDEIRNINLEEYKVEISTRKRTVQIVMRRPLLTQLDERLRLLKTLYPAARRTKWGKKIPNPEYKKASLPIQEYRKQLSRVQKADRLTLTGKI